MTYIILDADGAFHLPKAWYEEHASLLSDHIPVYTTHTTDTYVVVSLPNLLTPKIPYPMFHQGEEKETTICHFCQKRLLCLTEENRRCDDFVHLQKNLPRVDSWVEAAEKTGAVVLFGEVSPWR